MNTFTKTQEVTYMASKVHTMADVTGVVTEDEVKQDKQWFKVNETH